MGFCDSLSKVILIILNVLFFLIGAVIMGVGIWLKTDSSNLFNFLNKLNVDSSEFSSTNTSVLQITAIVLIVIGVFTFITGFCGCCGAIKESSCLLYSYSFLVGLVIVIQVAIGIYAGINKSKLEDKIGTSVQKLIKKDFRSVLNKNTTAFSKVFTGLMVELKCCGVYNKTDFKDVTYGYKSQKIAVGCCQFKNDYKYNSDKYVSGDDLEKYYVTSKCPIVENPAINNVGCLKKIESQLGKNLGIVIGVVVGLAVFEILCIVFACCVARRDEN